MIQSIVKVLSKTFNFSDRLSRKDYWSYAIPFILIYFMTIILEANNGNEYLSILFLLLFSITNLSAGVKRLHDSNCSGWYMMFVAIPVIGFFAHIYLMTRPSTVGRNKYGEKPL